MRNSKACDVWLDIKILWEFWKRAGEGVEEWNKFASD